MPHLKPNNGSDLRVRTIDLPFQNRTQAGLRVQHIVIRRLPVRLDGSRQNVRL